MGLASSATLMGNLVGPLICALIVSELPLEAAFITAAVVMLGVHVLARTFPREAYGADVRNP